MENDLKSLKEQYHINEIGSVERFTPNKRKYTVFIISDSNMSQVHVCIKKYNVSKALVHSDQGWKYQNIRYSNWLKEHNLVQSMSRKATTHDNIMIEIFFGRMKVEMFYGKENAFKDLNDLEKAIKDYIKWYNSDRV